MSTQHKPSIKTILSEAYHVITSNPRHFSILSLMFLFPISVSALILNVLRISASPGNPNSAFITSHPFFVPVFALIMVLLSLCSAPSITYSAFHAYYDVPLRIVTSLQAILNSFLPVLATLIATQVIFSLALLAYGGLIFVLYCLLVLFGVNMDSSNLIIFAVLTTALLMIAFVYMGLNLGLSNAVVVIESKWGFEPLKRSLYLVKGMRGKLFCIMILFGTISSALSSLSMRVAANAEGRFTGWEFLLPMTIVAVFTTLLSLYGLVTIVVVYVHCKELHGEFERFESKNVRSGGKYQQVYSGVEVV